ncbi:hypothetical protein B0H13DRAFT_1860628 [Mycena leptocephala]|nr:hypothetical protein B0H13DRAFT_1860628 [Mycena leptocephala]
MGGPQGVDLGGRIEWDENFRPFFVLLVYNTLVSGRDPLGVKVRGGWTRVRVGVRSSQPGPVPGKPEPEPAGLRVDDGSRLASAGRDPGLGISCQQRSDVRHVWAQHFKVRISNVTVNLHRVPGTRGQPAGFGSGKLPTRDPYPPDPTREPDGFTRTRVLPYKFITTDPREPRKF